MTICHVENFSTWQIFFSTSTACGACDKYQVWSYSYWPPPTFLLPVVLLLNSTAAMNVCQEGGVAQGLLVTHWGRAAGSLPDKFIAFHVYHCHRGIGQNEEKYIQCMSLFLSNGWQHIFEDTAHCWRAKREKDDQLLFLVQPNLPLLAVAHLRPLKLC